MAHENKLLTILEAGKSEIMEPTDSVWEPMGASVLVPEQHSLTGSSGAGRRLVRPVRPLIRALIPFTKALPL